MPLSFFFCNGRTQVLHVLHGVIMMMNIIIIYASEILACVQVKLYTQFILDLFFFLSVLLLAYI